MEKTQVNLLISFERSGDGLTGVRIFGKSVVQPTEALSALFEDLLLGGVARGVEGGTVDVVRQVRPRRLPLRSRHVVL